MRPYYAGDCGHARVRHRSRRPPRRWWTTPRSWQAEYDALFEQLFRDPADLDVTFRYAEVSALLGNFEAAVSALERMLLFNPDLPRVRLELGVLYFRLGSFALAPTYLTRALEAEEIPSEVQARVEVFLAEIDRRLSPHQFSGSIYSGLRYQTNANSGPSSTAVRANSLDATLSEQFTEKSDPNAFVSGNVRYLFDTQTQAGTVWETNGFFYATEQQDEDQVELVLFAVDAGPRAALPSDVLPGTFIRPYATADQIFLGDSHFLPVRRYRGHRHQSVSGQRQHGGRFSFSPARFRQQQRQHHRYRPERFRNATSHRRKLGAGRALDVGRLRPDQEARGR